MPLLISTKLAQKNPFPNICAFPSLTGVFKKVVNSSLEGSMRLISSHPHDAKIGSLDQDHYFTVWCFQDCGEIVERHWADCRRVFADSSEIKVIIEVDTARSLRQQPSRVSCAAICRPFICQATSYQPLSRARCSYQPRFSWSQLASLVETPNLIFVKFIKLLSNSFFVNLAEIWWNSNCIRIWDINLKLALSCK